MNAIKNAAITKICEDIQKRIFTKFEIAPLVETVVSEALELRNKKGCLPENWEMSLQKKNEKRINFKGKQTLSQQDEMEDELWKLTFRKYLKDKIIKKYGDSYKHISKEELNEYCDSQRYIN